MAPHGFLFLLPSVPASQPGVFRPALLEDRAHRSPPSRATAPRGRAGTSRARWGLGLASVDSGGTLSVSGEREF